MIWTLFAYIFIWVAFFCLLLVGLLIFSGRFQTPWLKRLSARFGETPADTLQVRGILRRIGFIFLAAGILFLLIAAPKEELSPEELGRLTLIQVACGVTIFWQVKGIRNLVKTESPVRGDRGKGKRNSR